MISGLVWTFLAGRDDSESATADQSETEEAADDATDERSPSTTARTETTRPPTTVTKRAGAGGIAPGTGLSLVLSGGRAWRVLDLETGSSYDVEQRGDLVDATAGYLLAYDNEDLTAVPLGDLTAEPVRIPGPRTQLVEGEAENQVWIRQEGALLGSGTFNLFDIASEEFIGDRDVPGGVWTIGFPIGRSLEFVSPPTGGVYRHDGERYRLTAPGALVAQNDGLALIDQCDEQLDCAFEWRDTSTWEIVDRPVPERGFDVATLIQGSRWLLLTSWQDWSLQLFDSLSGEIHELDSGPDSASNGPSFSPDGRWMAQVSSTLRITDLETMETVQVDGSWSRFWSMVFVDAPLPPPG